MAGDDYEVGYGKPPRHTRFAPGKSGNPSGRPKKPRTTSETLARSLARKIEITENGQRKKITTLEALIMRLVSKAAAGDNSALKQLLQYALQAEALDNARPVPTRTPDQLRASHDAVLKGLFPDIGTGPDLGADADG